MVKKENRCGVGLSIENNQQDGIIFCEICIHWWQPNNKPIKPYYLCSKSEEWWENSGICTRFAPSPSNNEDRTSYWFITNAKNKCGDGEKI